MSRGLTAATFILLAMLNISAIRSMLKRSPKKMRLETRMSSKTVHGVTPALRPRLPSSCSRVGVVPVGLVALGRKPRIQGSWNCPLGEYFELYVVPHAGSTNVFGRPVSEESCRLSPLPVMMLNGRPDETSITGANVQSLISFLPKLPPSFPV